MAIFKTAAVLIGLVALAAKVIQLPPHETLWHCWNDRDFGRTCEAIADFRISSDQCNGVKSWIEAEVTKPRYFFPNDGEYRCLKHGSVPK